MPITSKRIPLDSVGRVVLVENSQRVNALSVTNVSDPTVSYRFDLGNSQLTSPIVGRCVMRWPKGGTVLDKQEGVAVVIESAQPADYIDVTISYQRKGDPPNDGITVEPTP